MNQSGHDKCRVLIVEGDEDIRAAIEHLKHEAVDLWGKTRYPISSPSMSVVDARLEGTERVLALRREVDALRQALSDDYRKTYIP